MKKNEVWKTFTFDVMVRQGTRERFVCSMAYKYCPLFKFDMNKLIDFIYSKRPSLRNKSITIEETNNPVNLCR